MRRILGLFITLWVALSVCCHAQNSATIRGTNITSSSSASSVSVNLPTGSQAGDTAILFSAGDYSQAVPTGWTQEFLNNLSTLNGMSAWKQLTTADITAGSVTVTQSNTQDLVVGIVVLDGTVPIREVEGAISFPNSATQTTTSNVQQNDMGVYFAACRQNTSENPPFQTSTPSGTITNQQTIGPGVNVTADISTQVYAQSGVESVLNAFSPVGCGQGAVEVQVIMQNQSPPGTMPISGRLTNPDTNDWFNGYIKISLLKAGIKNTCTTPYQVVPTFSKTYHVKNGYLDVPTLPTYVTQDCMAPRIPYYVELDDNNHNFLTYENWYFPQLNPLTASYVDLGTMENVGFGGPITVAIPQAIISNPAGNQTVTQPFGTYLIVNNLEVTGNFTGASVQSAQVAGRLANNPSQCGGTSTGLFAVGIDTSGNAQCQSIGDTAQTFPYILVNSNLANVGKSPATQGFWAEWSGQSRGETDFINDKGLGFGGFNFYNVAPNSGALGSPIVSIDASGNITAPSFIGTVSQATHSAQADSLTNAPGGCGANQAINTIQANGYPKTCITVANANPEDWFLVNLCPTGMSGQTAGSYCSGNIAFSTYSLPNYVDNNYAILCQVGSTICGSGTCQFSMTTANQTAGGFSYSLNLLRANTAVSTTGLVTHAWCVRRHN